MPGHLLLHAIASWGHVKPLCNFAANVVKSRPIYVTLAVSEKLLDKIELEISRNFVSSDEDAKKFIRVVSLPGGTSDLDYGPAEEAFRQVVTSLSKGEAITCAAKGTTFEVVSPPKAAIIDFFALYALTAVHDIAKIPVLAWGTHSPAHLVHTYGPVERGGAGDMKASVEALAAKTGKGPVETLAMTMENLPGKLITIGDLPPMYDWEFLAQPMPPPLYGHFLTIQHSSHTFLKECQGIVLTSDPCIDNGGIGAVADWTASEQPPKKVYSIGPQLPLQAQATVEGAGADIHTTFLDSKLATHGSHSVVYISFGTTWGPWGNPEKLWIIVDVLIEKNVPFILAHASPQAIIPEEISAKIERSGLGILSKWTPQEKILAHKAIGWFLTHSGQNSVIESLSAGVPMICWDFFGDQPVNAVVLSVNLNVAYQLLEVRSGPYARKPIYRTGKAPEGTPEALRREFVDILEKAKGADGDAKRAKAERIRDELFATTREGGQARQALVHLLDDLEI
ncbi:UDP-Glycosyltransferase/glycogen phosphorylase [Punctularia strigosozonata HHB-11173 SS5]|uniref:UDP-Glycosyltransferase/glycogen phosphorylase n=1 Tax=Punctularia strigosozonata (strain HHB-11173) TaxID=741275 RepID=UPI0004416311|nr:UDP-Glycosyltransferase/glycogen phosphorylase [Punctularia strigosozonata HHB-11173 SS5]EIN06267.1 UDP-Glycosyltransferase/glycogen phosphorylase [Punctularia strigosozonata HHB-11173 SS5]